MITADSCSAVVPQGPQVFSSEAAPSHTDLCLYRALWVHCPKSRTWLLSLLSITQFLLAHSFSLAQSLYKTALPSNVKQAGKLERTPFPYKESLFEGKCPFFFSFFFALIFREGAKDVKFLLLSYHIFLCVTVALLVMSRIPKCGLYKAKNLSGLQCLLRSNWGFSIKFVPT